MGIKFCKEPQLKDSIMFCGWPGIGNIGLAAIDTLRGYLRAREFAEIEPWDFFDPQKVIVEKGLLKELEFPTSKFYYRQTNNRDVIFFVGERQPSEEKTGYGRGQKAYRMADLVLDVAEQFNCRRVYTSGAAVTRIHHSVKPKVWAVCNNPGLLAEVREYENTVLMSDIEGAGGQGAISGLNGLLLGVAKKRGLEAICLMGEIPYYLQAAPWPYPKASKSVLEVLVRTLGIEIRFDPLDELAQQIDDHIDEFFQRLFESGAIPEEVKHEFEKLEHARQDKLGPITEEEQKKIMDHIDELFHQEDSKDERHL